MLTAPRLAFTCVQETALQVEVVTSIVLMLHNRKLTCMPTRRVCRIYI